MQDSDKLRTGVAGILFLLIALPLGLYVYSDNPLMKFFGFIATLVLMGIHESGHYVPFAFLALARVDTTQPGLDFLITLGGSLAQVLFPAVASIYALLISRSQPLFFCFLAITCFSVWDVGEYMASAENPTGSGFAPMIGIVSMSEHPESHDWRNIFTSLGVLDSGNEIGWLTINVGAAYGLAALFSTVLALAVSLNDGTTSFPSVAFFGTALASGALLLSFNWLHLAFLLPALAILALAFAYNTYRAWEKDQQPPPRESMSTEASVRQDNAEWFSGDETSQSGGT